MANLINLFDGIPDFPDSWSDQKRFKIFQQSCAYNSLLGMIDMIFCVNNFGRNVNFSRLPSFVAFTIHRDQQFKTFFPVDGYLGKIWQNFNAGFEVPPEFATDKYLSRLLLIDASFDLLNAIVP